MSDRDQEPINVAAADPPDGGGGTKKVVTDADVDANSPKGRCQSILQTAAAALNRNFNGG